MHTVSISIVTLVAMWATIIFQCYTIHIINKRKVPDELFDKDINVHSKNESQTSGVVWTEDAIKDEPKSYSIWASTDETQMEYPRCAINGTPFDECGFCEHFNCDTCQCEAQTELVNDSQILVKDLVDDEFNPYDEECMRCKHLKLRCEFVPSYCKYEPRNN